MNKKEEKKQPEQVEKIEEKEVKRKGISNNMYLFNRYRQAFIPSFTR